MIITSYEICKNCKTPRRYLSNYYRTCHSELFKAQRNNLKRYVNQPKKAWNLLLPLYFREQKSFLIIILGKLRQAVLPCAAEPLDSTLHFVPL